MLNCNKTQILPLFHIFVISIVCAPAQAGSWYKKPWKDMYQAIHTGRTPEWKTIEDAQTWIRKERQQVEPVIVSALRGEREDLSWNDGILVAQALSTEPVRDALLFRLNEIMSAFPEGCFGDNQLEAGAVAQIIAILGEARDRRILPFAISLPEKDCQSHLVVERCVEAIRLVGNGVAVQRLQRIPLRMKDPYIDRLCRMTEKIVTSRMRGTQVSPDAQRELRELAERFIHAAEARDYKSYIACLPFGFEKAIDEGDMNERLEHPDGKPGLAALSLTLGGRQQFEVDLDNLRATLGCQDDFQLECILEVDGWKVVNLKRVSPREGTPEE